MVLEFITIPLNIDSMANKIRTNREHTHKHTCLRADLSVLANELTELFWVKSIPTFSINVILKVEAVDGKLHRA